MVPFHNNKNVIQCEIATVISFQKMGWYGLFLHVCNNSNTLSQTVTVDMVTFICVFS